MAIKLKLDGWAELLEAVRKTEGDVDAEARRCIERSAQIFQEELKKAIVDKGDSEGSARLARRMPGYEIEGSGERLTAHVGFKSTSYDPDNLSDYFKATFLNYGTPRERPREFVKAAKSAAKKRISEEQEKAFANMTKGLTNK